MLAVGSMGGTGSEAARVYHAAGRCSRRVAARGASAAGCNDRGRRPVTWWLVGER